MSGFQKAEAYFLKNVSGTTGEGIEKSGSCAIVCLIVDDTVYIANVGDSRAIMSA